MRRKGRLLLFLGISLCVLLISLAHLPTRTKLVERWNVLHMKMAGEIPETP